MLVARASLGLAARPDRRSPESAARPATHDPRHADWERFCGLLEGGSARLEIDLRHAGGRNGTWPEMLTRELGHGGHFAAMEPAAACAQRTRATSPWCSRPGVGRAGSLRRAGRRRPPGNAHGVHVDERAWARSPSRGCNSASGSAGGSQRLTSPDVLLVTMRLRSRHGRRRVEHPYAATGDARAVRPAVSTSLRLRPDGVRRVASRSCEDLYAVRPGGAVPAPPWLRRELRPGTSRTSTTRSSAARTTSGPRWASLLASRRRCSWKT
jgi:hypothetical protein